LCGYLILACIFVSDCTGRQHLCVCSLDGAGWVAGIRKDQEATDPDKPDVMLELDDNYEIMVGERSDLLLCVLLY